MKEAKRQEAIETAAKNGWFNVVEDNRLDQKNTRAFQQKTLSEIYEAEALGIDCTALRLHILEVEAKL